MLPRITGPNLWKDTGDNNAKTDHDHKSDTQTYIHNSWNTNHFDSINDR